MLTCAMVMLREHDCPGRFAGAPKTRETAQEWTRCCPRNRAVDLRAPDLLELGPLDKYPIGVPHVLNSEVELMTIAVFSDIQDSA